jgi:cytohesin
MSTNPKDVQLFEAVSAGQVDRVRELLAEGASPDAADEFDTTVLVQAIDDDHEEIARLLLEAGADPNRSEGGDTPLMKAARSGLQATTRLLLDKGADVSAADEGMGMTALHWTVWWSRQVAGGPTRPGSVESTRYLVSKGSPLEARSHDGSTALHMAATLGELEIVRLLLEAGASPAAADEKGFTPAHLALHRGFGEVIEALAARHDVRADPGGPGPLGWAARLGDEAALRSLPKAPKKELDETWRDETALLAAARLRHVGCAVALLAAGASPDAKDEDGRTALSYAAERGQADLVDALVKAKASLAVPKKSASPLVLALWERHADVAARLIDAGMDVNAGSQPALAAAASRDLPDLVRRIVAAGADVKKQGREAVLQAADSGAAAALRVLLEAGADPDAKDENRWPAICNAAGNGHLEAVVALIEGGANVDAKGDDFAAVHWAAQDGQAAVARVLVKHGAKVKGKLLPLVAKGEAGAVKKLLGAKADVAALDVWPPLTWAALLGELDIADALLAAGADPKQRTNAHPPHALAAAAMHGRDAILDRLVAAGALSDAAAGGEALHLAAEKGQAGAVRRLLAAGVSPDVRNRRNKTALFAAAEEGRVEAVRALLEGGADPKLETATGETALAAASRRERADVVEVLKGAEAAGATAPVAAQPAAATPAATKGTASPEDVKRLVDASDHGDLSEVARLVAAGVDVNARDERNRLPLEIAVRKGHAPVVEALVAAGAPVKHILSLASMAAPHTALLRRLVDLGADVNHFGDGLPPIVAAVRAGNVDAVRLLLERGADPSLQAPRGGTALFSAVLNSKRELADMLLDAGADPSRGDGASPPLVAAVGAGLAPLARRLLLATLKPTKKPQALVRAVADGDAAKAAALLAEGVPATSAEGTTKWPALHLAALFGETAIAKSLLGAGADASVSKNGWTPLALALKSGHAELAGALLEKGADPNAAGGPNQPAMLLVAAAQGDVAIVDLLLKAGARVDAAGQGSTGLHLAARNGHVDVARRLVEGGAKVDAKDKDGRTPLVLAVQYDHLAAATALVEAGAKVDVKWNDRSLVHWAVLSGRREAARMLMEHKAKVDVADADGASALHAAARLGDHELVDALLHARAKPNAATLAGRTPLMEAAWSGDLDAVRRLLDRTDADWRDAEGRSAADVAAEEGETGVLELLVQHHHAPGADLYLAVAQGDAAAVARLLAGARPAARTVLLAVRCADAAMVRTLLDLKPHGDLGPAKEVAVAEGLDEIAGLLGVAVASEPRRLTERMLDLVKIPPPDSEVVLEGAFGRFLRAEPRLEMLVQGQMWTSERHSMRPRLAQVDAEMAGIGYHALGAIVCERIGDVVLRAYGAAQAEAFGAWNVGVMGTAMDFVSYLSDGSSLTTTTHEESKTSARGGNYVRAIPDASVRVLHHKHELRVARRAKAVQLSLDSAEPSLVALARAVDRSLVRRFAES